MRAGKDADEDVCAPRKSCHAQRFTYFQAKLQADQNQVLAFQQFSWTLTFGVKPSSLPFTPETMAYWKIGR